MDQGHEVDADLLVAGPSRFSLVWQVCSWFAARSVTYCDTANDCANGLSFSALHVGGTASGKTTVCDQIMQRLHDQCVVMLSQDSFYRGLTPEECKNIKGKSA